MEEACPHRCSWVNAHNSTYVRYHDEEWGVPVYDDHLLGEMLFLELLHSGLSWECVLMKREAFRQALDNFIMEKIAHYDGDKIDQLMANPRLIRHRKKLEALVVNARVFLTIQQEWGSFANYLWQWTDHKIIREQGLTSSSLSDALARDLRTRGMRYVGSITLYAYLQAVGVLNGHEPDCFMVQVIK